MKKITTIIVAVALVCLISFLAIFFVYTQYFKPTTDNGYSQEDLDKAKQDGKENGQEYKEYLDGLIAELEEKINNVGNIDDSDLTSSYDDLIKQIEEHLNSSDTDLNEITQSKIALYNSTLVTLNGIKTIYNQELNRLQSQLVDLNQSIDDIKALEGDSAVELAGLEYAKSFIVADINGYTKAINSVNSQISDIEGIIAELKGG